MQMKPPDCVGSLSTRQSPWLCQRNVLSLTLWMIEYMTPVAHKKERKCKAGRQCHLLATTVWLNKSFLLFLLQMYSFETRNISNCTYALQLKCAFIHFIFQMKKREGYFTLDIQVRLNRSQWNCITCSKNKFDPEFLFHFNLPRETQC